MATTMVHVRVDEQVKVQAAQTLETMGLSVSDAVRMMLVRVAAEKGLPFNVRVPNTETIAAMKELDKGGGKHFESVEVLIADLNSNLDDSVSKYNMLRKKSLHKYTVEMANSW